MTLRARLLAADTRYSNQLRYAEKPGLLRRLAIFLAHSGDSWFWGLGLALVWLGGSPATKQLAVQLLAGVAITAVIALTLKRLIRRARPAGDWGSLYRRTDPHSFPSGHATRMTMLLVLGAALGPAWLGWLLLIWAPLVALARVAMGVHYLSDVIGGALLGLVIGVALVSVFSRIW
jgi:membrane-associated phospholipid phosphatase